MRGTVSPPLERSSDGSSRTVRCLTGGPFTALFSKKLTEFYREQKLCDVIVSCRGCQLKAHRLVLAANSDYFCILFDNPLNEETLISSEAGLPLHRLDLPVEALRVLLDSFYSTHIEFPESLVEDVLCCASFLQVHHVLSFLRDHFAHKFRLTGQHNDLYDSELLRLQQFGIDLLPEIRKDIAQRFHSFIAEPQFLELESDDLLEFLSRDDLLVRREDDLFAALMRWLEHQPDERLPHMSALLGQIRFALVSRPLFELSEDATFRRHELKLATLTSGPTGIRSGELCLVCLSAHTVQRLVLFGADSLLFRSTVSFQHYGFGRASIANAHVLQEAGQVYVAYTTGVEGDLANTMVDHLLHLTSFDFRRNLDSDSTQYVPYSAMKTTYFAAVVHRKSLYVIGGRRGVTPTDAVQQFSLAQQRLTPTDRAPLPYAAYSLSAVVSDDRIYVCGGRSATNTNHTVESNVMPFVCFDPATNQWTELTPYTGASRYAHQLLACGQAGLYVVSGFAAAPSGQNMPYLPILHYSLDKGVWSETVCVDCQVARGCAIWRPSTSPCSSGGEILVIQSETALVQLLRPDRRRPECLERLAPPRRIGAHPSLAFFQGMTAVPVSRGLFLDDKTG